MKNTGSVKNKTCKKTLVPRTAVRFPVDSAEEHMLKNGRWYDNKGIVAQNGIAQCALSIVKVISTNNL